MDRRLYWIARNGAFAAALYFAVVAQVDWLQPAMTGIVWLMLAISVRTILQESRWRSLAPIAISQVSGMAFDLAVLVSMFIAHWYWTAFAYAISCGCVALAQARAAGKP